MPKQRGSRTIGFACVLIKPNFYYGFPHLDTSKLGVSAGELSDLGWTLLNEENRTQILQSSSSLLVLGATSPKPPRVKKTSSSLFQKTVSLFCGYDKLPSLLNKGWLLSSRGKSMITLLLENGAGRKMTALIPFSNFKIATGESNVYYQGLYAFPVDKGTFSLFGSELGLISSTALSEADLNRAYIGADYPKPGRATKRTEGGSVSCFYAPDKRYELEQNGWKCTLEKV